MTTNSQEATLHLDRNVISGEYGQPGFEKPQQNHVTESGRPTAGGWAAAIAVFLTIGHSLGQLIHQGAPTGESNFNRQIL